MPRECQKAWPNCKCTKQTRRKPEIIKWSLLKTRAGKEVVGFSAALLNRICFSHACPLKPLVLRHHTDEQRLNRQIKDSTLKIFVHQQPSSDAFCYLILSFPTPHLHLLASSNPMQGCLGAGLQKDPFLS